MNTKMLRVVHACAAEFGTTTKDILSRAQFGDIRQARLVAYWVLHKTSRISLSKIGLWFDRDHSTISHGVRRIEERRQRPEIAHSIDRIMCAISAPAVDVVGGGSL